MAVPQTVSLLLAALGSAIADAFAAPEPEPTPEPEPPKPEIVSASINAAGDRVTVTTNIPARYAGPFGVVRINGRSVELGSGEQTGTVFVFWGPELNVFAFAGETATVDFNAGAFYSDANLSYTNDAIAGQEVTNYSAAPVVPE